MLFRSFALNFFASIYVLWRSPSPGTCWGVVVAAALVGASLAARTQALTVQDRLIRLEMTLRLAQVLPADLKGRVGEITRGQFVALRFASDAELPGLVKDVLGGSLTTQKAIKERIKTWQPDHLRA
mgnify:CR=1 FL=1